MNIDWDNYLPEVMMEVEGCLEQLASNYIRRVAIDFCERTRIWSEDLDPISIIANDAYCDLEPPDGSTVISIPSCRINLVDVQVFTEEQMTFYRPGWRNQTTTSYPDSVVLLNNDQIQISPVPTLSYTDAIDIMACLKPTRDSTSGPDFLYNDWLDAIAAGAKQKLLLLPNKKWSNPQLAAYYMQEYMKYIGKARIAVARAGGDKTLVATPQPFGGV